MMSSNAKTESKTASFIVGIIVLVSIALLVALNIYQSNNMKITGEKMKTELSQAKKVIADASAEDEIYSDVRDGATGQIKGPSIKVRVFYKNAYKDPGLASCEADEFLERDIPLTKTVLKDAINILFTGPSTPEEKARGAISELQSAVANGKKPVTIKSVTVKNGVATVTLDDPDKFTTGGTCRVMIMKSQIEKTILQFPAVKSVKFEPLDLFQS